MLSARSGETAKVRIKSKITNLKAILILCRTLWGCSKILYVKLYYFISIYYFAIFVEINIQLILPKCNLALSDEGGAMSEKCWIFEMSWSRPVSAHYVIFPLHLPAWLCSVSPQQTDEDICRYKQKFAFPPPARRCVLNQRLSRSSQHYQKNHCQQSGPANSITNMFYFL